MSTIVLVNVALPSSTPQLPVAAEGINKLPSDILANIASFLPTREKFSTMRQVCKEWNTLPFDGEHLDLSNVKNLSDRDLRNILDGIQKRGGKITSLKLYWAVNITDAGLAYLAKLPLTSLDLSGCHRITNACVAHLTKLPLTSLNLSWCHRITAHSMAHLAKLPLTSLDLTECGDITDACLAHLAELPLTFLNLTSCINITDAGLAHLPKHRLTSLNLSGCENITNAGVAHLAELPLTCLNLYGCRNITDPGLAHLAELRLRSLNLTWCENITDAGLAHLGGLPLTSLNLAGCSNITNAGIAHVAQFPLTSLSLYECRNITDDGVAYLAKLPLTSLNLSGCRNITDDGLAYLAKLPLVSLNLSGCYNITDAGFANLAELPLTSLSLSGCRNITNAGAGAFKAGLIPSALTDVRLRGKIDHYVYVLASQPKGGDRWGEIHRYEDHNRLRLAQAIAAQTLSESFKDSWLEKSLNVIEILDLTGSSVLNEEQRARIEALLGAIPANIRSDVDDQVYPLAPEPKVGKSWGQLHRYDDLSRLRRAVIKALENSLFTTFPLKPKTGLSILRKDSF